MRVGVIPAAGYATRLGLDEGTSKETIRVRGRPVVDFLVERMRAADVDELRIVTRPEKEDLVAHARAIGARVVLGHPDDVSASLRLGLEGLDDADEVLFGFPDTVWGPEDGLARVAAALDARTDVALGLFRTPDAARSDVVVIDDDGRVTEIAVKPEDPPTDLIWGCAATRAGILRGLGDGEEPGAHFGALAPGGRVAGVWLSADWIDVGTPEALERMRD